MGHCTYIMGHVCVRKNNSLFCIRLAIEVQKKISLSFEHWPHVLAWRHKLPNFFFSQAKSLDFYTFFKLVYYIERGSGDTLDFVSFTTRWSESIFCTLKLWNREVLHALARSTEIHFFMIGPQISSEYLLIT